jgi:hypothetical protein
MGGFVHSKIYDYQEFFDLGLRNRLGMDQLERLSALALRTAVLSQRPGAGKLTGLLYAAGNLEGGWMIRTPLSEESHDLSQWQTAAALTLAGGPVQLTVAFLGNAFGLNIPFDLPTPTGDPYNGSGNYADNVQKKYLDDYLMVSLGFRGLPFLDWLGFSGTLAINEAFPESAGGRALHLFAPPESVWLGGSLGASLGNLARVDLLFDPASTALRTLGILRGADVEFVLSTLIYKIFAPKKYSALAASTWNPQAQDFTRAGVVWAELSVRACQPAAAAAGSSDPLYRLDVALPAGPFGIGTQVSVYGADWLRAPGSIPFHDVRLYGLYATRSSAPLRAEAAVGFSWVHDGRLVAYGARTADVFGFDLESRLFFGGRRYPVFGFEFGLRRNHPDELWTLPDLHGVNRFTIKFFGVI